MEELVDVRHTIADYEQLPEGAPYQLIDGELVMSPAPTPRHQDVLSNLFRLFDRFVGERQLGKLYFAPIDVYLSDTDAFQPDLLFISKGRLSIIGEKNVQGAPDLVVEILSLSTSYYDLTSKRRTYEAAGVREYWVVDPMAKRIEVYENRNGRFTPFSEADQQGGARSKVLEGFGVVAAEVFA